MIFWVFNVTFSLWEFMRSPLYPSEQHALDGYVSPPPSFPPPAMPAFLHDPLLNLAIPWGFST